jgi:probable rRNA maturation factor
VSVFLADEQDEPLDAELIQMLAESVLEVEGFPPDTEVSLLFVGEEQIATYNERFMHRSGPTDVLAFPVEHLTPGKVPSARPGGPPLSLGDVVIAPAVVRAQAASGEQEFSEELELLVVHGLLHLLGYDHDTDARADVMEERERTLLDRHREAAT